MTEERNINQRADDILRIYTFDSIDHMNTMLQKADMRDAQQELVDTRAAWNLAWFRARKSTGFKPMENMFK